MAAQAGSSPLGPGSWLQGGATLDADADAALWKELDFGLLRLPLPRCVNHKEGRPCGGRTFGHLWAIIAICDIGEGKEIGVDYGPNFGL